MLHLTPELATVEGLIKGRPGSLFQLNHEILSDDKNDFTVTEKYIFYGVSYSCYYN